VSFAAGAATALININPTDDTLAEGSETVILTLAAGTGYTVGTTNTGTVTITDNEVVLPTITIAATDAAAGETATGVTGTVSFAAGAATALININPIDDTLAEGSETVILTLGTGTGYTLGATKTGTVTLMDDEPYNLTFSTETIDEGQAVTFTLETRGTAGTEVPYTISGVNQFDISGTSLKGIFITDNNGMGQLTLNIADDLLTETDETLTLKLDNRSELVKVQIKDTSQTPVKTLKVNSLKQETNEGEEAVFVIQTQNIGTGTEIAYTLIGISEDDVVGGMLTGTAMIDKTGAAIIRVALNNDNLLEGDETLKIGFDGFSPSASTLIKDTSNPRIYGTNGNDNFIARLTDSEIFGDAGDDKIQGGVGNDTIWGGDGIDHLKGGAGNDIIWGMYNTTGSHGEGIQEFIYGEDGDDFLVGGNPETNLALTGAIYIDGGKGNDFISDRVKGFNILSGGEGNDTIYGRYGLDGNISGDAGDDVIYAGQYHGINGGAGTDTVYIPGSIHDYERFNGWGNNSPNGAIDVELKHKTSLDQYGKPKRYFISDVEYLVFENNPSQKIPLPFTDAPFTSGFKNEHKTINIGIQNKSLYQEIPAIVKSFAWGPDFKTEIEKTIIDKSGKFYDLFLGFKAGIEGFLKLKVDINFNPGTININLPTAINVSANRFRNDLSVHTNYGVNNSASYQINSPQGFFKSYIDFAMKNTLELNAKAEATTPAVKVFGETIIDSQTFGFNTKIGLPENLKDLRYTYDLIDINALNKTYEKEFKYGNISAKFPQTSFTGTLENSRTLSGSGSDSIVNADLFLDQFILEKTPIPLAYTYQQSLGVNEAGADVFARFTALGATLKGSLNLNQDIDVTLAGFRAKYNLENNGVQTRDFLLGGNSDNFFVGDNFDLNGNGRLDVGLELTPIVQITNKTYLTAKIDAELAIPKIEYGINAHLLGNNYSSSGAFSLFKQTVPLFNFNLPTLYEKTWEISGLGSELFNLAV